MADLFAFILRRSPTPTNPSSAAGTAKKATSLLEEDGFCSGRLMASMVEPAELSGWVGLGAEAAVLGTEVVSATNPELTEKPADEAAVSKPPELKYGEL